MMRSVHPLLRLSLLFCPSEFRRRFADDLAADLDRDRSAPLPLTLTCLNVAWTGMRLHAENVWRDVAYAARVLAKAPLFVTIATLTIALAIAANLTAFSVLKGVLIDPLPYPHGARLAFITSVARGEDQTNIDYPDAQDYAQRSRTFEAISVETQAQGALTGRGRPVELQGWYTGADYFTILGAQPELGRLLSRADLGKLRIVISDALWRSRFRRFRVGVGRRVTIDGRVYAIVGVAPPYLRNPGPGFVASSDYWLLIDPRDNPTSWRGHYSFFAIGLLRSGVSWGQAQADLSRIAAQLARQYPQFDAHRGVRVRSLADVLVAPMRTIVVMSYGAAILVLLIAAANIANLLLVRAAARDRSLVVRSALGATRKRLAQRLTVEMALVTILSLILGIALAVAVLHAIGGFLAALGQAYGMDVTVPDGTASD